VTNLVNPTEYGFSPDSDKKMGNDTLGKQQFLELLMTQIQHQDPLNPMDDKQFIAQMAEFTSLEQLTNIDEGIQDINDNFQRQDMMNAVSFLGQEVKAQGYTISKGEDSISKVFYGFDQPVSNLYVNIFDEFGNLIHTDELGSRQPGNYEYDWDGQNWDGREQPDGVYQVAIGAETADGKPVTVDTSVSGTVSGVVAEKGEHYLRLTDGRVLNFLDVNEVVSPASLPEDGE
jgi:flagellar basal-body rod modification protein FlgD